MTNKVKATLEADTLNLLPDNTSGQITAQSLRSVFTDHVDSCFRDPALLLEAGGGRLLLETGAGYITQDEP